jgi:hypothetical protein
VGRAGSLGLYSPSPGYSVTQEAPSVSFICSL